eukprot:TRINITY_DN32378_c0_g1_i1.p1 TRINITY_DN32378_c0_g1~~TRINITY_DN32378_c0_g1_i1.p1  ORF type:complete len:607 (+),score=85.09 TRINITY_DN32378_c0_g1_i1:33-1823(+)
MGRFRVCAWASWAEWRDVYHLLSSASAPDRHAGVRRVQTWRTRGRLPVAIDVTGSFVEIMLCDPEFNPEVQTARGEHELQLMYSMANIRLVNGIVDIAQQGRAAAGSILNLAKELDWPQMFVDLRHEATHQRLPSLPMLRLAAKEAVWLLFERFWQPQLALVESREIGRAPMPRDKRTLGKRLRRLVAVSATKKRRVPPAVAPAAAEVASKADESLVPVAMDPRAEAVAAKQQEEEVLKAVRELADLGADESRLLQQISETMLTREPSGDLRELRAIDSLCARSSDNFALRLVRIIAGGALGFPDLAASPLTAPDGSPSLRNICDLCYGDARPALKGVTPELSAAFSGRMLRWLHAIAAPPSTKSSQGTPRLRRALSDVAPLLERFVFRTLVACVACPSEDKDTGDHVLGSSTLPERRTLMERLARLRSALVDMGVLSTEAKVCNDEGSSKEALSMEKVQALLRATKEQRTDSDVCDRMSQGIVWTDVGTTFDPETLQIRCRRECGSGVWPPEQAAALAREWTSGTHSHAADVQHSSIEDFAEKSENVPLANADRSCTGPEHHPVSALKSPPGSDEGECRKRAAVLLDCLCPYDLT